MLTDPDTTSQKESTPQNGAGNIDCILAMKVPVIVRIAQKKMTMADILKFNLGIVIQFDQDAYQHIELMANNAVIGLGQPVKVGEKFGLKITQISRITDTIKALGQSSPPVPV